MRRIKLSKHLMIITTLFFFGYNTYFGWNDHALSDAEKYCDSLTKELFIVSFALYFSAIFGFFEQQIEAKYNFEKFVLKKGNRNEQPDVEQNEKQEDGPER